MSKSEYLFICQNGKTVLHYAAYKGQLSSVKALAEAGADLDITDEVQQPLTIYSSTLISHGFFCVSHCHSWWHVNAIAERNNCLIVCMATMSIYCSIGPYSGNLNSRGW